MTLPDDGLDEATFLALVERIARLLRRYQFGIHGEDDLRQMVAVMCLEALPRYRPEAGTAGGFLYTHCANQLFNLRRKELGVRHDSPCAICHAAACGSATPPCGEDGQVCAAYELWAKRGRRRARLCTPLSLNQALDEPERGVAGDVGAVDSVDLVQAIEGRLPEGRVKDDFKTLMDGGKVSRTRRERVRGAVNRVLEDLGLVEDDLASP